MDFSRISLRPFKLSDVDDFFKWSTHEKVVANVRWDPIKSIEEARNYLETVAIPHQWHRSICLDDRSIGYVAIWKDRDTEFEKHKGSIGYAVAFEHWGRGIATVALKMSLKRVFEDLPDLVRVEGYTVSENLGSQRVLEKVGFQREGLLRKFAGFGGDFRDLCLFSFLATDNIL